MCEGVHGSLNERPCKEINRSEINGLFNHLIQKLKKEHDQHWIQAGTGFFKLPSAKLNHDLTCPYYCKNREFLSNKKSFK